MTCKNHILKLRQTYALAILKSPLALFIYLIPVSFLSGNKELQAAMEKEPAQVTPLGPSTLCVPLT